jgi:hypothetical protein
MCLGTSYGRHEEEARIIGKNEEQERKSARWRKAKHGCINQAKEG